MICTHRFREERSDHISPAFTSFAVSRFPSMIQASRLEYRSLKYEENPRVWREPRIFVQQAWNSVPVTRWCFNRARKGRAGVAGRKHNNEVRFLTLGHGQGPNRRVNSTQLDYPESNDAPICRASPPPRFDPSRQPTWRTNTRAMVELPLRFYSDTGSIDHRQVALQLARRGRFKLKQNDCAILNDQRWFALAPAHSS